MGWAFAEFAMNNSWQELIKITPLFLTYGMHPLTPLSASLLRLVPGAHDIVEWIEGAVRRKIVRYCRRLKSTKMTTKSPVVLTRGASTRMAISTTFDFKILQLEKCLHRLRFTPGWTNFHLMLISRWNKPPISAMVDLSMAFITRGESRFLVKSTTTDYWMKQSVIVPNWSLVEPCLLYLRWLIQLWLFQLGVWLGIWWIQLQLISSWNRLRSFAVH